MRIGRNMLRLNQYLNLLRMSRKDKRTTEEFLLQLKESGYWNDDYDYSLLEYNGKTSKIIVFTIN